MFIHTVEIDGIAIASWNTEFSYEGNELFENEAFREDLTVFIGQNGKPLWDGKSELKLRRATTSEADIYKKNRRDSINAGDIESSEEIWLMYHVPVKDPTDD